MRCTFTDSEDECDKCTSILEELENIDDDCERHGIIFIKTRVNLLLNIKYYIIIFYVTRYKAAKK